MSAKCLTGRLHRKALFKVFKLIRHPKAKHCFAWSYQDDNETKVTAVLEIPPVNSAETAVKVAIAAKGRQSK